MAVGPAKVSRQHPFFSPLGCLGGFVLILGIVLAVAFSGGAIFSPGALTAYAAKGTPLKGFASHAEFQNDCRQCHAPMQGILPERCEACHTDVGAERASSLGLHGRLRPEEAARCERCHPDHQGPEFNPNETALKKFDHTPMGFSLARHIANYDLSPMACQACHTEAEFALDTAACIQCHRNHDATFMLKHLRAFGQDCMACHDGVDKMHAFDHTKTDFALEGQHAPLDCTACHTAEVAAQDTPTECAACHVEPLIHAGVFPPPPTRSEVDCAACHTSSAWTPAKLDNRPAFTHADTAFQLDNHVTNYDGTPFTCRTCHVNAGRDRTEGDPYAFSPQTCIDCHAPYDPAFMEKHVQNYGPNCVSCHDGTGNMANFDHNTIFVLDGRHAALPCLACHVEQTYIGTPNECVACHAEPEIHAGLFGVKCQTCHNTTAWSPAMLTQHTFPLDHGGQGEIACATCHTTSYMTYTCYGCHDHDPAETRRQHDELNITEQQLANCAACHPTGHHEEEEEND